MFYRPRHKIAVGFSGAILGAILGLLMLAMSTQGASADGATRAEFDGTISGNSPCNGDRLVLRGTVSVVYHEGVKHSVQLTFKGAATGSLGNSYTTSMIANEQFASPSASFGAILAFNVPYRAQVVSRGSAPNFSVDGTIRVFVENGQPVGAWLFGGSSASCHG